MIVCNLTNQIIQNPIFTSKSKLSITSLSTFKEGKIEVYYSKSIGHLITKPIIDTKQFYDIEYKISLNSEDEDQLYEVINNKKIFRTEHQVKVLLSKLTLNEGAKILDYGCAKGAVVKRLIEIRPDLVPYLFDVSDMYVSNWEKFTKPEQRCTYTLNPAWKEYFDVITAFFVLEHVEDPIQEVLKIRNLLKDNGIFFFTVPNVYQNIADFIVCDHINHFSLNSIVYLLSRTGFEVLDIDENIHRAAFVVVARKTQEKTDFTPIDHMLKKNEKEVINMSTYWSSLIERIESFERCVDEEHIAIYGAGVYGNFIFSSLKKPNKVKLFIDQNVFLHGREILGVPIKGVDELPENISSIFVGLNPLNAKKIINEIEAWKNRNLKFYFL